jgi:hypothetical protein
MRNLRITKSKIKIDEIKDKFYVFDTETTSLEPMPKNFVFGVIYGYNYQRVIYSVQDFKYEFSMARYNKKYIFAHNAEFDLLTIFGNIITEIDNNAVFNGKFIMAKYNEITFADSMNIYPTSVEKIGIMLGSEKHKNVKVKTEGLTVKNITNDDIDYCVQDCRIVYEALLKIFETIGDIKLTLASLAMFQFRSKYLPENIMFLDIVDEFYESYYGGRTEAFKIGVTDSYVYDINSLYPTVMQNMFFPDIKHLKKLVSVDVEYLMYLLGTYEGLAKVTVRHKETYFGYLPVRMEVNKSEKLVFPVGTFETTVNFNELLFAIESGVVEILKVHHVVYGNPIESPFTDFVNDNYNKRLTSDNELDKTIYKLIMNSLYGRFAMRMKLQTTYYDNIPFDLIEEIQGTDDFYELKIFNKDRSDCYLITENEKMKASFFSIPTFSSYITSAARVELLKGLLANEKNNVCYCDTDSIFLEKPFIGNVGTELGQYKKENKHIIEIRGLKNYSYITDEGMQKDVIKGISKGAIKIADNKYQIKKYIKTKQAINENKIAGESYIQTKELTHEYDKREVLYDGSTKALKLPLKEKKIVKKVSENYDPSTYYEAILMFFASGGKVKKQDVIDYVTGRSKEIKLYKRITSNNGVSMDVFNDYVSELLASENPINEFIDVLSKFYTINQMKSELKKLKIDKNKNINILKFREYDYPF